MKTQHLPTCFVLSVVISLFVACDAFAQVGPIIIDRTDIDDDESQFAHDQSNGNNNDIIEAGETIRLRVYLTNIGTASAEKVVATVITGNEVFDFDDMEEEYETIGPGETREPHNVFAGRGGFIFTVRPESSTDSVKFDLQITTITQDTFFVSNWLFVVGGQAGPFAIAEFRIDDDTDNFANDKSYGDNDDLIEPGEIIGLPIRLRNTGDHPAVDVKAVLRSSDSRIAFIDSMVNYGIIDANDLEWPKDFREQFHFEIDTEADSGNIDFRILITTSTARDTTIELTFHIEPRGTVRLRLVSALFEDDRNRIAFNRVIGNGNDILEPREVISIIPRVENTGTASALSVKGILRTDSPHVTILDSLVDFESIRDRESRLPNGVGDAQGFMVRIAHTAPTGAIQCQFTLETGLREVFHDTIVVDVDASMSPPPNQVVVVAFPEDGRTIDDAKIDVFGYVDDFETPYVIVNGDSVVPKEGVFEAFVLTGRGVDTVTVTATNSSGETDAIEVSYVGKPFRTFEDKSRFFLHHNPGRNIDTPFLSEFGAGCTRAEFIFNTTRPDSVEWTHRLQGDIVGDQYFFSLLLASRSSTNYLCEIIHSRNGIQTVLASRTFFTSSRTIRRFEAITTGVDPDAFAGDSLILKISFDQAAHIRESDFSSDPFGCSSIPSYVDIPKLIVVSVEEPEIIDATQPQSYNLSQNYPNPFNPMTTIRYELPNSVNVRLDIFNVRGERVTTLVNEAQALGHYSVVWDGKDDVGRNVASGVYFYKIKTKEFTKVRKLTLLR